MECNVPLYRTVIAPAAFWNEFHGVDGCVLSLTLKKIDWREIRFIGIRVSNGGHHQRLPLNICATPHALFWNDWNSFWLNCSFSYCMLSFKFLSKSLTYCSSDVSSSQLFIRKLSNWSPSSRPSIVCVCLILCASISCLYVVVLYNLFV